MDGREDVPDTLRIVKLRHVQEKHDTASELKEFAYRNWSLR